MASPLLRAPAPARPSSPNPPRPRPRPSAWPRPHRDLAPAHLAPPLTSLAPPPPAAPPPSLLRSSPIWPRPHPRQADGGPAQARGGPQCLRCKAKTPCPPSEALEPPVSNPGLLAWPRPLPSPQGPWDASPGWCVCTSVLAPSLSESCSHPVEAACPPCQAGHRPRSVLFPRQVHERPWPQLLLCCRLGEAAASHM